MPIKVVCQCGQAFAAKDEWAGKTLKCPKCQSPIPVPMAQAPGSAQQQATHLAAGLQDLLDEEGFAAHVGVRCTKCNEPIPPGGVICVRCGHNIQTGATLATNVKRAKTPGHGEAAEAILDRAAIELQKAPPPKDETAGGMLVSYVLTIGMFVLVGAAAAGGFFLFRMMEGSTNKAWASGLSMLCIGSTLTALGAIWIAVVAFMESVSQGLLCLFVPFYQFYYGIVKGYKFQLFLIVLGGSMQGGGVILMVYFATPIVS